MSVWKHGGLLFDLRWDVEYRGACIAKRYLYSALTNALPNPAGAASAVCQIELDYLTAPAEMQIQRMVRWLQARVWQELEGGS